MLYDNFLFIIKNNIKTNNCKAIDVIINLLLDLFLVSVATDTFFIIFILILQVIVQLKSRKVPLTLRLSCGRIRNFGRNDRIRTCDIVVPNHARYQLRYIPKY